MSRKHITQAQVKLYMKYRTERGLTQEASAAKVGMSPRTARTIDRNSHPRQYPKKQRDYKTRRSALDEVWDTVLVPLLENQEDLQPRTLFLYLERHYQDAEGRPRYKESLLRTLQRRVAVWKACHGKICKDVMFPQEHRPGQQGLSDFTHFKKIEIRIGGKPLKHMFYHFRLVYSKWSYLKVICTGETFQALAEGLQEALFHLGGAPYEHRTDSLSAAFKNLSKEDQKDLTQQYEALCHYYGMRPTRNNKGRKHENGSVESSHGHLKNRIAQEILLRGSNDFPSLGDYEQWLHQVVQSFNRRYATTIAAEKEQLQPLPTKKTVDYEVKSVKVSGLSLLLVKGMRYSVPSQFSGHTLTLHIYQQQIKCYLGMNCVFVLDRKYQQQHKSLYVINYRHLIQAFIRKPGAFRYCKYRNELFPSEAYRKIWDYLEKTESPSIAPKKMLRLLKLAADSDCEAEIAQSFLEHIREQKPLPIECLENQFLPAAPFVPQVKCSQHALKNYDQLMVPCPPIPTGESHAPC